ncbi:hypothetical protein V6N13_053842 [Hibiscus sabdariffa]
MEFLRVWPDLFQNILAKSISDHNAISLSFMGKCWGTRPFKWFDYLADDNDYFELIKNECSECSRHGIGVVLKNCKMMSKDWVSNKLGNSRNKIQLLERRCAEIEEDIYNGDHDQRLVIELRDRR